MATYIAFRVLEPMSIYDRIKAPTRQEIIGELLADLSECKPHVSNLFPMSTLGKSSVAFSEWILVIKLS